MGKQELDKLKKWLEDNPNFPYYPQKRTLMDIMGIQQLENPWSKIYAFFLNEREEHRLGDLFIRTLEKIMGEKEEWIHPTDIIIEQPTTDKEKGNDNKKKEKRIDILIKDDTHKRAIIIENKVRHCPNNPFNIYIDYVQKIGCDDIRVVILTLHKISEKEENKYPELQNIKKLTGKNYVNITHEEYITEIEKQLPRDDNSLYYQILNHFILNIKNLTNMVTSEEINFFLSHFKEINKIFKLYSHIMERYKDVDFNNDVVEVEKQINTNEKEDLWIYMTYKNKQSLRLTIFLFPLFDNKLRVILELNGKEDVEHLNKDKSIDKDITKIIEEPEFKEKGIKDVPLSIENTDINYRHLAEYFIPVTPDDLNPSSQLQDTLERIVDSPIYNLGLRILDYLQTK